MVVWNILNTVLASVAIFGAYFAYQQVALIRKEQRRREREEQEYIEWSGRADKVIHGLAGFILKYSNGLNGVPSGPLYPFVITDGELRRLIETHLVRYDMGKNHMEARPLSPELLRLPVVRKTIERLEQRFDDVRRDEKQLAALASLLS